MRPGLGPSRALSGCSLIVIATVGWLENVVATRSLANHAAGMPQIPIPPRTAVDAYFAHLRAMGVQRHLDVTFDVDLGELVEGHHVVVRGIERGPGEAVLHYEFVPAVQEDERQDKGPVLLYWMVSASDDTGTEYDDHNTGGFDPQGAGRTERFANRTLVRASPLALITARPRREDGSLVHRLRED